MKKSRLKGGVVIENEEGCRIIRTQTDTLLNRSVIVNIMVASAAFATQIVRSQIQSDILGSYSEIKEVPELLADQIFKEASTMCTSSSYQTSNCIRYGLDVFNNPDKFREWFKSTCVESSTIALDELGFQNKYIYDFSDLATETIIDASYEGLSRIKEAMSFHTGESGPVENAPQCFDSGWVEGIITSTLQSIGYAVTVAYNKSGLQEVAVVNVQYSFNRIIKENTLDVIKQLNRKLSQRWRPYMSRQVLHETLVLMFIMVIYYGLYYALTLAYYRVRNNYRNKEEIRHFSRRRIRRLYGRGSRRRKRRSPKRTSKRKRRSPKRTSKRKRRSPKRTNKRKRRSPKRTNRRIRRSPKRTSRGRKKSRKRRRSR
jgi:hypothetical protein